MKKEDLHKAVFESYSAAISNYHLDAKDVNLSTTWCLDRYDMDFFVVLLEEKIPEDFSFLKEKRFDILQDVCSEIEYYFPVETEVKPHSIAKSENHVKNACCFDKQRN